MVMEDLRIGKVLKPRGLKGELKVQILTNRPQVFFDVKNVLIGGREYGILQASQQSGFVYLYVDGIKTIEMADLLKGKYITVTREQFGLEPDEVLDIDLIGFDVIDAKGNVLGKLESLENFGGGEVLIVGEQVIPYEDEFISETNMNTKKIILR